MLHRRRNLLRSLAAVSGLTLALAAVGCGDDGGGDGEALCGGTEFTTREDALLGLQDHYEFEFPTVNEISDDLVYSEVDSGACLFGSIFATDGRIAALDLVVLEDDQSFFPPFNASLNIRQEVFDEYPELEELFAPIAAALDDDTMSELNALVDAEGESEQDVAQQWLEDNDFLGSGETPLEGASLTVGSKEFTEQNILGYMTMAVLEDAGADIDDEIGLVGSQTVRQAIENGDVDMYWEYLGTGWVTYLENEQGIPDVQEQYEALRDADAENGIVWLEPTPFNNTYGIAMTQAKSDELGITTISDVKAFLEE